MNNIPNAELENEENTLNPDGSSSQYSGEPHSRGGIPTNLDPGTLIFSDRLKLGKKTFADLNRKNNTNKEDKVIEDPKSNHLQRITASLMKDTKVKQSLALFDAQEALKQSKLTNYANRLGINPNNKYAGGGMQTADPTDYAFNTGLQDAGKGAAAGAAIGSIIPGVGTLLGGGIGAIGGGIFGAIQGANKAKSINEQQNQQQNLLAQQQFNATQQYPNGGKTMTPAEWSAYNEKNGYLPHPTFVNNGKFAGGYTPYYDPNKFTPAYNTDGSVKWSKNNDPNYNFQTGMELPVIQYTPSKPMTPGNTFMNDTNNKQITSNNSFSMGGLKKYTLGGQEGNPEDPTLPNEYGINYTDFNSSIPTTSPTSTNTNPSNGTSGTDWSGIASQVLQGVTQNAGNIYDLSRTQNPTVQHFDRVQTNLVDPTSELNYNNQVFKSATNDLRNASVGNSSTYIQNRKDLAINQMLTNARIKSQYDNQNAGIKNNTSSQNANIQMQESNANLANKDVNNNVKANALGNIGQNIMSQRLDNKMTSADQQALKLILAKYPNSKYDPYLSQFYKK